MNRKINSAITSLISRLDQKTPSGAKAFLGFDACIDTIVRIVKSKNQGGITEFFNNSSDFGEFLINHESKSCGVELRTQLLKPGGNMVITANALGMLGISVDCIGTFGIPEILPIFKSISGNCRLHSIGETIAATALEFNDNKIILFDPGPYNELSWEAIRSIIGIDRIKELITGKKLVSFLNWSEIENSSSIWKGFLEEVMPAVKSNEISPIFFTDFSDCSRRSRTEIQSAIGLLARFRNYFTVILSLNSKEAELTAQALDISAGKPDEEFIRSLFGAANSDILVIHRSNDAIAFDGVSFEKCDTFFCEDPLVLTGGGDNFNAGFCYSMIHNFDLFQTLITANAVSGYYVKTGTSPDLNNLRYFLEQKLNE